MIMIMKMIMMTMRMMIDDDDNDDDMCRNSCCYSNITVYGNHKPVVGSVTPQGTNINIEDNSFCEFHPLKNDTNTNCRQQMSPNCICRKENNHNNNK